MDRAGPTHPAEGLLIMIVAPSAAGVCRLSAVLAGMALVLVATAHAIPASAESAALYEQNGDAQSKRYVGTVTWSVEKEPPSAGAKPSGAKPSGTKPSGTKPSGANPSLALRGDIVIPERHMAVSFLLRRNTDRELPATHTIDIMFKLPPDFPGRGIANLAGVTLAPNEQVRGTALAGLAAKVTDGYFLFGLSALAGDAKLNASNLRDGKWLEILIVYGDGTRAIVTVEKGVSGDQAFKEALAAWEK